LSLQPDAKGKINLLIHPVYRKAVAPEFLNPNEARQLQQKEVANLLVKVPDGIGRQKELLVEYDSDTREYIISDTEKILAPDMVNGEFLTPAQRRPFVKAGKCSWPTIRRLITALLIRRGSGPISSR
jgi:hypothetical protein